MFKLFEMIFDRKKRKETYDYYDQQYKETEEEKEILKSMSKRRINKFADISENDISELNKVKKEAHKR